jgi:hypothetical protein
MIGVPGWSMDTMVAQTLRVVCSLRRMSRESPDRQVM